jgi:hypothetical protein
MKLFLSFASKDIQHAEYIYDKMCNLWLGNEIESIFFAPKKIRPGSKWDAEILNALKTIDLLFVLWSDQSRSSYGQQVEIGAAWGLSKKILVLSMHVDENSMPFILKDTQVIRWGAFKSGFEEFMLHRDS